MREIHVYTCMTLRVEVPTEETHREEETLSDVLIKVVKTTHLEGQRFIQSTDQNLMELYTEQTIQSIHVCTSCVSV